EVFALRLCAPDGESKAQLPRRLPHFVSALPPHGRAGKDDAPAAGPAVRRARQTPVEQYGPAAEERGDEGVRRDDAPRVRERFALGPDEPAVGAEVRERRTRRVQRSGGVEGFVETFERQ